MLGVAPVADLQDGPVCLAVHAPVQQDVVQLDVTVGDTWQYSKKGKQYV
jgi:hypothetical protein